MISVKEKKSEEWLTLQEASEITGKSIISLRMLIKRKRIEMAKKIVQNGRDTWVIHNDALEKYKRSDPTEHKDDENTEKKVSNEIIEEMTICQENTINLTDLSEYEIKERISFEGLFGFELKSDEPESQDALPEEICSEITYCSLSPENEQAAQSINVDPEQVQIIMPDSPDPANFSKMFQYDQLYQSGEEKVITMPVEYFEEQLKSHDHLLQGMMMYRHKFEELDRQLKSLSAPPIDVKTRIEELEKELIESTREKNEALARLRQKLEEEEKLREDLKTEWETILSRLEKPWWKRLSERAEDFWQKFQAILK